MKSYLIVIGDLVQSKKLDSSSRKQVQNCLKSVFQRINNSSNSIVSPYTITLGDEFQVVYQTADQIFNHLWMISTEIHPVFARFSISLGEISTEINREQALGMDGPAFHRAREQVEMMKENNRLLAITTDQENFNRLVNSTFRILETNLNTWKKNRFSILYQHQQGRDVKQIAHDLGLSEVAVYKNIHAGALDAISELTNTISETLNQNLMK